MIHPVVAVYVLGGQEGVPAATRTYQGRPAAAGRLLGLADEVDKGSRHSVGDGIAEAWRESQSPRLETRALGDHGPGVTEPFAAVQGAGEPMAGHTPDTSQDGARE